MKIIINNMSVVISCLRKFIIFLFTIFICIISIYLSSQFNGNIFAAEKNINCENRYLSLVNPVRGRNLWFDKDLKHIKNQYSKIAANGFNATWLIQYDVLSDKELLREIVNFNTSQEIGVFLEISDRYAQNSRVVYPYDEPWFSPNAVFLSAYSQSDRKRLIDRLFLEFKKKFGYFPKSVGAWWIDSYSLNYLVTKYRVRVALIVADQKTTDNYGVWGQWWGIPYYPSKANILTPANNLDNKQDIVITQWAQRDPLLAFGNGPKFSNYSLQANDYIRQGKNLEYFKEISSSYLDCQNKIGQITVGLETGIESIEYLNEYENQLKYLSEIKIKSLTLSDFAKKYIEIFPDVPKYFEISNKKSTWVMTTDKRINSYHNEVINYDTQTSFSDYFIPDENNFLDRSLDQTKEQKNIYYFPYWLLIIVIYLFYIYFKKYDLKNALFIIIFLILSFGLLLRSYYLYGWKVYFGPVFDNLIFAQSFVVLGVIITFHLISKKINNKLFFSILPLSFFLDTILNYLRISYISGKYYFGLLIDSLRFAGLSFERPIKIQIINQDLPAYQAVALLKFDYSKVWNNIFLSVIIYPLVHIVLGALIFLLVKKFPRKLQFVIILVLIILTSIRLVSIFEIDPRLVRPIF